MSDSQEFAPQRHDIAGENAPPGMDTLGDHFNAISDLEKEIHLDVSQRRAIAAGLHGLGWRQTPHLAEHLAWLLSRETDALTAYSLYVAVRATHPQRWTLYDWQCEVLRITPFPLLRTAIFDDFFGEGFIDTDSADGTALLSLLDTTNSEHRALLTEHHWLAGDSTTRDVAEVVTMLRPTASMAEKVAGMRIVQFASDPRLDKHALPALTALFRVERHPGLSLKIADTLVRKRNSQIDLDMVVFLIQAWHRDGIPAAKVAMGSVFYGVEGFLMDNFMIGEQRPSALTDALLASFSPAKLPDGEAPVIVALKAISTDMTQPLAAFAATAVLDATRHASAAGTELVFDTARSGADPAVRALAIRVLGQQPRALLPLLDDLKALTVAANTDPRVRRSAFHALINTHQSALPTRITEVIDLYFRYLTEAPVDHFGDALHGSDAAKAPEHLLARMTESFDAIESQSARQAALQLVSNAFAFGIEKAFEPFWMQIIHVMLKALDNPRHGDLHYTIFWNLLHDVDVPQPAANEFAKGLTDRLARVKYTKRSRGLIEHWLERYRSG